jgi:choline dehydrogenase-like flavoprotein
LAILALDHEDRPGPGKYCRLHAGRAGASDQLEIGYTEADEVWRQRRRRERALIRLLPRLGCLALKRVWPGDGASLRYGGTFPMTRDDRPLTVEPNGRLRGTRSIYLVDSSTFPYLSAKGVTFTMMANANRIGEHVRGAMQR